MITFSNLRQWALSVCIAAFALGYTNSVTAKNATEADNIYSELPFQMNKVQLPVFPDYSRSITEFGAVADGITLNTAAFDKAIKAVAEKGGGKVIVPAVRLSYLRDCGLPVLSYCKATSIYIWKKTHWFCLQPTTLSILSSKLHSKDWKHAAASHRYQLSTLKTLPSPEKV